jgi:predicted helicase
MFDAALADKKLAEKYNLKNNRDWNIGEARKALQADKDWQKKVIRCAYRPFDNRHCFFGPEFMDYPRRELLDNVAGRDNVQLVVSRQIGTANWRHALVAVGPANDCLISDQSSEANQVFPLWRFDEQGTRQENLSPGFRAFVDARYEHHYTPEEILGYVYACTRQRTAGVMPASYASTFHACPFPNLWTISRHCRASAGLRCRYTYYASCPAGD